MTTTTTTTEMIFLRRNRRRINHPIPFLNIILLFYATLSSFLHNAPKVNAFLIPKTPPTSFHHQQRSNLPSSSFFTSSKTQLNEAPVPFAGVGPRSSWVDLTPYNIQNLTTILSEWTVNIIPKTLDTPARIELGIENKRELFVDTIIIKTKRKEGQGFGIELEEIRGGRNDGVGVTVVSGVVEGGLMDQGEDIMAGDVISSISVIQQSATQTKNENDNEGLLEDRTTVVTANTECLDYDNTVAAISSLPPPPQEEKEQDVTITLKRIRRKPIITINLQYPPSQNETDTTIQLYAGENLRLAMLVRGIKLNDPLAKRFDTKSGGNCGAGGLCRTCAVSISRGKELLNPQKLAEEQMLGEEQPRWRLSCKAFVGYGMKEGEMTVQVNPRQW